jgi:hypothetical protein
VAPACTFVLALGIRLWWVRHAVLPPYGDQPSLEAYAANVAHGLYYGTRGAYWPPAFVFLAGLVERLFGTGHTFLAVRTANAVLGALAAAVTADLARRLGGSAAAGLLGGAVLALSAADVYYTDAFLAATLEVLTVAAVCDAAVAYAQRPTGLRLGLTGVLLGLAALTKPTELPLVIPAAVHWGLCAPERERRARGPDWGFAARSAAIALAVALLVNVPWSWRNLRVTGVPVFVDVNGGVDFYIAHGPKATGRWVDLGPADPVLLRGSGFDRPDTAGLALRAGLAYFVSHPRADVVQAARILRWFWTEPDGDIERYGAGLAPVTRALHVPLLDFPALRDLALLGLAGLAALGRRAALVPLVLGGYSLGIALLFWAPRFRLPMDPLLAAAAGAGLAVWARAWLAVRRAAGTARPSPAEEPVLARPADQGPTGHQVPHRRLEREPTLTT